MIFLLAYVVVPLRESMAINWNTRRKPRCLRLPRQFHSGQGFLSPDCGGLRHRFKKLACDSEVCLSSCSRTADNQSAAKQEHTHRAHMGHGRPVKKCAWCTSPRDRRLPEQRPTETQQGTNNSPRHQSDYLQPQTYEVTLSVDK